MIIYIYIYDYIYILSVKDLFLYPPSLCDVRLLWELASKNHVWSNSSPVKLPSKVHQGPKNRHENCLFT